MTPLNWEKYYTARPEDMIFPDATSASENEKEIITVRDLDAEVDALYSVGFNRGLSIGWTNLEPYFRLRKRELTVITGWPGHGKSAFIDNVMINMARAHGWKWAVFSAENLPLERHIAGLSEIYIGKPFTCGIRPRMEKADLDTAKTCLNQHMYFSRPSE